jgi:serine protease Do
MEPTRACLRCRRNTIGEAKGKRRKAKVKEEGKVGQASLPVRYRKKGKKVGVAVSSLLKIESETAAIVERLRRSVVQIDTGGGTGSGIIWGSDGLIVTNDHVARSGRVKVELTDGRKYLGTVVARDRHNDLALVQIPARDLEVIPSGDSTTLRVGELVLAVGNPFGVRGTATMGIVTANSEAERFAQSQNLLFHQGRYRQPIVRELLQADVALAPGNSGGPLADAQGRVVGIACMIAAPGIALAIPVHVVTRFVSKALAALSGTTR